MGQTNTAIIRDSRAAYNVMGFEIENVQGGEYDNNVAECNTGGFLIYDLENITQYGDTSVMVNNLARNNNTYNFAHSGLVSVVPRGVGFITLGYDNIEVFDNVFEDHSTAAVLYISYELIDGPGNTADKKLDPYTEGLHIHDNVMTHSGYDLPPPDLQKTLAGDIESVLPTLIGLKNLPTLNDPRSCFPASRIWPTWVRARTSSGTACATTWTRIAPTRWTPRAARCPATTTASRFTPTSTPIRPATTTPTSSTTRASASCPPGAPVSMTTSCPTTAPLSELPWHRRSGAGHGPARPGPLDPDSGRPGGHHRRLVELPSDTRLEDHDCQARFGRVLEPLPRVEIPPFEPSGDHDPATTEEYTNHLCEQEVAEGEINRAALEVDCPRLEQYNLFADADDPRSLPHEGGVPFVLNTKLFSDYATKYRVAFIPPGEQAVYRDGQDGNNVNGTIDFPVGTVIAKTFAFTDEANGGEELVETRLLIKRTSQSGKAFWAGLPYIWEQQDGEMVARFAPGGGSRAVHWHYRDANTGQVVSGETAGYSVPNANQCITCHGNDDRPGAAPHRAQAPQPEPRLPAGKQLHGHRRPGRLPRVNQLQYWIDQGLLAGAPDLELDGQGVATNIERLPRWNVPGDGGASAHSAADVEQRVRAYLEVNCQHCHNDKGAASNTGYYLDHYRAVDAGYGICKKPTATGGGSCGRQHVVVPGSSADSIVACRLAAENDPQRMMPPIARSVAHNEASALMNQWIDTVVDGDYTNAGGCAN